MKNFDPITPSDDARASVALTSLASRSASDRKGRHASATEGCSNTRFNEVLLTECDLAKRQSRSVKTIRNQRLIGSGVPYIKIGRLVRYRLSDVEDWENARLVTSTSGISKQASDEAVR